MHLKFNTFLLIISMMIFETLVIGQSKVRNLTLNTKKANSPTQGKKSEKSKYHVKVYYNFIHTSIHEDTYSPINNQIVELNSDKNTFGRVSAGFVIENGKSTHEIELSRINFAKVEASTYIHKLDEGISQITAGQIATKFNLNLKYEYNRKIISLKDNLEFLVGASFEPYFQTSKTKPKISTTFDTRNTYIGLKFYILPRLTYNFSKRFYLDLNFPIEYLDYYWMISRIDNPTLPKNLQRSSDINSEWFNKIFQLRLGVGIRI